jgi:hypothetical protein
VRAAGCCIVWARSAASSAARARLAADAGSGTGKLGVAVPPPGGPNTANPATVAMAITAAPTARSGIIFGLTAAGCGWAALGAVNVPASALSGTERKY